MYNVLYERSLKGDANSHLSRSLWKVSSSSAIVLRNMVEKVDEYICNYWGGCGGVGGLYVSDMRGDGDDFLGSLGTLLFGVGLLHFTVAIDGLVLVGCEVVAVGLVDFGVMHSSFGGLFGTVWFERMDFW